MSNQICVVVGTRPGIIMMAPIIHELERRDIPHYVLHTGQHYSPEMDSELFEDLRLSPAAHHLEGVSAAEGHGGKTAKMLEGCEKVFLENRPALVIVNGDANTNLAAALAARKLGVSLAHSEAGERSYDWRMPEEHNRRIMDHISEVLFATSQKAAETLSKESVMGEVYITGNTIVDASLNHAKLAEDRSLVLKEYNLRPKDYLLLTSHREENVDYPDKLLAILKGAIQAGEELGLQVVFPVHPRTYKNIQQFGYLDLLDSSKFIKVLPALRYLDFLALVVNCCVVISDSGGVQQEAYIHKVPCVTVRDNTEWTETLGGGGNRLAGASDPGFIAQQVNDAYSMSDAIWQSVFGDGRASERIVNYALEYVNSSS